MKKIFSLLFILISVCFSVRGNAEINSSKTDSLIKNRTWITFDSINTKEFSESFKKKMAEDLYPKIYVMLDDKVSSEDFDFGLMIGLIDPKMMEKDGQIFIITMLVTEFAKAHYVTVSWRSDDFKNPMDIHKSDVTGKDVQFSWCSDFPKDELISELKPYHTLSKEESKYKFDVEYYLYTFPDVAICFDFEGIPSKQTLSQLEKELNNFKVKYKTVFVSELFRSKNSYIIAIDHNTIDYDAYGDKEYQKDVKNLEDIAFQINKNKKIHNLKRIRFK